MASGLQLNYDGGTSVTVIAHLTDLHLVEPTSRRSQGVDASLRRWYLTAGRRVDEAGRRASLRAALGCAVALGFDHLVLTGDLTEEGTRPQFEALASVLDASGIEASRVTLLPGNHDLYDAHDGWRRALEGPLRAYAATSGPGARVELDDAVLIPVSTVRAQHWSRSAGEVTDPERRSIADAVAAAERRGVAAVVAQHHPPTRVQHAVVHWFDGLLDHAAMRPVLRARDHTYVLHGHLHERRDRSFEGESGHRIFGAAAVVNDPRPVRRYRASGGALTPLDEVAPTQDPAV